MVLESIITRAFGPRMVHRFVRDSNAYAELESGGIGLHSSPAYRTKREGCLSALSNGIGTSIRFYGGKSLGGRLTLCVQGGPRSNALAGWYGNFRHGQHL